MLSEDAATSTISFQGISDARRARYRLRDDLKLKSRRDAVKFIEEAGVVLLFPGDGVPLPDLWSAINGYERQIPKRHHDSALSKTWSWKDEIPERREAWYGKLVRGKPAFLSFDVLPAVYALSPNFGELDDYLEQYADGLMSKEARDIYETLLAEGPMATPHLRKATGLMGGGDNGRRFDRAIVELQTGLKIVKSGISDANRWKYCYIYDLLLRWAPDLAEQSRRYSGRTAMRHMITRYLQTSVAAPPEAFPRFFGWEATVAGRVLEEMLAERSLEAVRVVGAPGLTARTRTKPEGEDWIALAGTF